MQLPLVSAAAAASDVADIDIHVIHVNNLIQEPHTHAATGVWASCAQCDIIPQLTPPDAQ